MTCVVWYIDRQQVYWKIREFNIVSNIDPTTYFCFQYPLQFGLVWFDVILISCTGILTNLGGISCIYFKFLETPSFFFQNISIQIRVNFSLTELVWHILLPKWRKCIRDCDNIVRKLNWNRILFLASVFLLDWWHWQLINKSQ